MIERQSIPALLFDAIHGKIRMPQQIGGRSPVHRRNGNADAHRYADDPLTHYHRFGKYLAQLAVEAFYIGGIAQLGKQDHEFVAPDPGYRITAAHIFNESLCHGLQQLIAILMTEAVVNVLEIIQIEKQHRGQLFRAVGMRDRLLQAVCEYIPVG